MRRCFTILFLCFFVTTFSFSVETPEILWTIDLLDSSFGVSAAGDIDGDGKLELVFGCYRNDDHIYAVNSEDGSILWKYNASFNGYDGCNDVAPILYDIDGDGLPEIFFIGGKTSYPDVSENYGKGYCLSLKSGTGPDWLMFQNNIHRTGSVCEALTSVRYLSDNTKIMFYPNPAGDFVNILIDDDDLIAYELQIVDLLGLIISKYELINGNNTIDISNLLRGTYFIKIGNRVEKLVKM